MHTIIALIVLWFGWRYARECYWNRKAKRSFAVGSGLVPRREWTLRFIFLGK
jgi:hypothetical protein